MDSGGEAHPISPKAGRREWIGLGVIALPCLLYSMDLTVLNLAVPALVRELKPSATQLLWMVDVYGFMVAGFLITMGAIGDRIGRRRLLMVGSAAFGAASVGAAFASTAEWLVGMRALLGIAGATLAPSTLSLIRHMFRDPGERGLAIGIWVAAFSSGAAVGPLIGGALLQFLWWGSVFLIAVPVMVALLIVGPLLLPEYRSPSAPRVDIVSAALSVAAVLALVYGLKQMAEHGVSTAAVFFVVAGIALGVSFWRRQLRLADPLLEPTLFRIPAFTGATIIYLLGTFAAFGMLILVSQYMQMVLGMGPLEAGLWTIPFVVALIGTSIAAPLLVRRLGAAPVMAVGLLVAAAGFLLLAQARPGGSLALLVLAFVTYAIGLAPAFSLSPDIVIGSAPLERAGAAAAIAETAAEFGGALGIALLGSIGAAVYTRAIEARLPGGLNTPIVQAARNTLGDAIAASQQLPEPAATAVLQAAHGAFTNALQVAAYATVVLMAAAAWLAWRSLRGVEAQFGASIELRGREDAA